MTTYEPLQVVSGEEEMPSPATIRPRARAACDECRRRKLRCDGRQPQCSLCHESGLICETTERGSRGPKKGYIKALKDRVVYLENLLEDRLDVQQGQSQQHDSTENRDGELPTPPVDISDLAVTNDANDWMSAAVASISEPDMLLPNDLTDIGLLSDSLAPLVSLSITSAIQSEL